MLNLTDRYIFSTFIKTYELNINNIVDTSKENLNIIFDEKHITDKIIDKFFQKISNYTSYIIYIAMLYSIGFNEKTYHVKFVNYIEYYKEQLNDINNIDKDFKRICLYNIIKYLIIKNNKGLDLIKEELVYERFISYFENIKDINVLYSLNDIIKITTFKMLQKYNPFNLEQFIIELINSNDFDNDILSLSYGFINNEKDIKFFKFYLFRIILLDAYVVENKVKNDTFKNQNINYNVTTPILNYIDNCIINNKFNIPNNEKIMIEMVKRYLFCLNNQNFEYQAILEIEKDKKKELIKINPFYKLK